MSHVDRALEAFSNDWLGTLGIVAIDPPSSYNGWKFIVQATDPLMPMARATLPKSFRGYDIVVVRSGPIRPL